MRYSLLIFTFIAVNVYADQSNFYFYDTNKTQKYSIRNAALQLSTEYKFEVRPIIIVVASKNRSKLYKKQFNYLDRLDAESLSLIFISALSDKPNLHGYHTDTEVAEMLLSEQTFMTMIYAPCGSLLFSSGHVIDDNRILEIIRKYNKSLE